MFVSLVADPFVDGNQSADRVSIYFNTSDIGAVVEDYSETMVKVIPMHGFAFLIGKDDWELLKKKIEAEQRKQLR